MTVDEGPRCSFCGRTSQEIKKLIAGPRGVYICNECVQVCSEILDEEAVGAALPEPGLFEGGVDGGHLRLALHHSWHALSGCEMVPGGFHMKAERRRLSYPLRPNRLP